MIQDLVVNMPELHQSSSLNGFLTYSTSESSSSSSSAALLVLPVLWLDAAAALPVFPAPSLMPDPGEEEERDSLQLSSSEMG